MSIEVKRSPAKVCWWLCVNGVVFDTFDRKCDAVTASNALRQEYNLQA